MQIIYRILCLTCLMAQTLQFRPCLFHRHWHPTRPTATRVSGKTLLTGHSVTENWGFTTPEYFCLGAFGNILARCNLKFLIWVCPQILFSLLLPLLFNGCWRQTGSNVTNFIHCPTHLMVPSLDCSSRGITAQAFASTILTLEFIIL